MCMFKNTYALLASTIVYDQKFYSLIIYSQVPSTLVVLNLQLAVLI